MAGAEAGAMTDTSKDAAEDDRGPDAATSIPAPTPETSGGWAAGPDAKQRIGAR